MFQESRKHTLCEMEIDWSSGAVSAVGGVNVLQVLSPSLSPWWAELSLSLYLFSFSVPVSRRLSFSLSLWRSLFVSFRLRCSVLSRVEYSSLLSVSLSRSS